MDFASFTYYSFCFFRKETLILYLSLLKNYQILILTEIIRNCRMAPVEFSLYGQHEPAKRPICTNQLLLILILLLSILRHHMNVWSAWMFSTNGCNA